jgi:hypothetical protein
MTMTLPPFAALRRQYPDNPSGDAVKKAIGGHVDASWIGNTCAIRLSRAFNYNGIKLGRTETPVLHVVSGADRNWYAYRMLELRSWIAAKFPVPTLDLHGKADRSTFFGQKGIIAFEIHFNDANGHLDLWDGAHYVHENADSRDYFSLSRRTVLWAAP